MQSFILEIAGAVLMRCFSSVVCHHSEQLRGKGSSTLCTIGILLMTPICSARVITVLSQLTGEVGQSLILALGSQRWRWGINPKLVGITRCLLDVLRCGWRSGLNL